MNFVQEFHLQKDNAAGLGYPQSVIDEHERQVVDPTWIMRPFIDRWTMVMSFLSVNPRLSYRNPQ